MIGDFGSYLNPFRDIHESNMPPQEYIGRWINNIAVCAECNPEYRQSHDRLVLLQNGNFCGTLHLSEIAAIFAIIIASVCAKLWIT